jgi:16S rRNA (guanine527-N7)-methyltransferase
VTPPDRAPERRQLAGAAEALDLALSDAQCEQLLDFRDRLLKWNAVYNLSALRDPETMLTQHVVDSLGVIPGMRRVVRDRGFGEAGPVRVVDVGSGGGLPGVVIAIVEPQWRVDCVDAVAKKVAFVRQIGFELTLPHLGARHARIESWHRARDFGGQYDIVISRAFAALGDFVRLSAELRAPDGVWAAMKGAVPQDEIDALPSALTVFHVEPVTLPGLDLKRCLVWMEPGKKTP